MTEKIRRTAELERILALPRREPRLADELVEEMTELLRSPQGTMKLRPLQALALHDIGICGGGFLPLDVGEGKTLTSLLVPYVLDAKRPLLMLPANLIQKTERERAELARHWCIPNHIRLMSYQMLGRVQAAEDLEHYAPDLVILDESQKVKNRDAAVTRRFARYMAKHPDTRVVAMTGTIMRKSILDFGHILRWCLKAGAPVPATDAELEDWALAMDENLENEFARLDPGALLELTTPEEVEELGPLAAVRRGFARRLRETAGVVSSAPSGTVVGVPLKIRALRYDLKRETDAHFDKLRNQMLTPDDWQLWEAVDVWRHAKELALGFHQIWSPRPPQDWRDARKAWFRFVRDVLSRSRTIDSPEQVAMALDAEKLPDERQAEGARLLAEWRRLEPTYKIHTEAVWHDDGALRAAKTWMAQGPGIVWTEHVEFAERLAREACVKYYGAKGLAADGEFIDDADPTKAAVVSVDANREGRNLQRKWSRNLVTSPEEGPDKWQQMLGRTHRTGQTAKVVTVDVFLGCAEHARAWAKAVAGARTIRETVGAENKLLIALESGGVTWPDHEEIESWMGARWSRGD